MNAGRLYKRFSDKEDFSGIDNIIIGSGIGGLATAVFLAKAGKKVLVLERHYVPGGFSHTFKRKDGFVWDVGVHYVGNMQEGSQLRVLFDYMTDKQLKWQFMGDVYDKFIFGSDEYQFPSGKENFRSQLCTYFPKEKNTIDQYLNLIAKVAKYGNLFFFEKTFESWLSFGLGWALKMPFFRYSNKATYDVLKSITNNEKLINVLCGQCGNYGLPPKESSFAAHAVVVNHFMEGGYYPEGGADKIYKNMVDVIHKHNGQVLVKAEVDQVVVEKGRVQGVKVAGRFIECKKVISNIGFHNTYSHLLKNGIAQKLSRKLNKIKPSTSHMCLYLGLNKSDKDLKLPCHNVWYYDSYKIDDILESGMGHPKSALKFAYISFPSSKDTAWSKSHPGKATIQAIGIGNYSWFEAFADRPWMKRGEHYEALKHDFKEKMLEKLYQLYPQIKGHVVSAEVSTPLTTKHFTNYQKGEIYGLTHSSDRFKMKYLRPVSPIKGLYHTGQDVVTVGVGGALSSGMLCAISLLKFGIARQFRAMNK